MGLQDYLPIYYQACKGSSPVGSSVNELPLSIFTGPTAALTAISVPLFQRYRTQLWLGWSLCTLSMGVFTIIHADTPTVRFAPRADIPTLHCTTNITKLKQKTTRRTRRPSLQYQPARPRRTRCGQPACSARTTACLQRHL